MNYLINFFNYMYKIISFIQGMVNIYNFYNIHNKILTPPVKPEPIKNDSVIDSLANLKASSITFGSICSTLINSFNTFIINSVL